MVRVFKWVLENTSGPRYDYIPWDRLPPWLANLFDAWRPGYLPAAYAEIDRLVAEGRADDLGNFVEATEISDHPANNVHNNSHGVVAFYESQIFGEDSPGLVDANMNSSMTAPHNEHFWGLHGWIDNVFARWQQQHSEEVDQSPLDPRHAGHDHMMTTVEQINEDVSDKDEAEIFSLLTEGASLADEARVFEERIFVPPWK